MNFVNKLNQWLETHWVTPAFAGGLLFILTLIFFLAASNTMAGWLYVISGVSLAVLVIAALLPARSLLGIEIHRSPIFPVSAGDILTMELAIANTSAQPKALLQIRDRVPAGLGQPAQIVIDELPAHNEKRWSYQLETEHRGRFRWQELQLRTAAPLGLFWCQRTRVAVAEVIVYPRVLPLTQCPLIDQIGQDLNLKLHSLSYRARGATEGSTRSLRPYRWGDPIRLVHWRSSARLGELRVRELEMFTGGQQIILALDTAGDWHPDNFEQAVIAVASLYFYARRHHPDIQFWTAKTGKLHGDQAILETLAEINPEINPGQLNSNFPPDLPLIWLTSNPQSLTGLPSGSRWLVWPGRDSAAANSLPPLGKLSGPGLVIDPGQALPLQLQTHLGRG
jgi:uncharacterized protein (DUF58 family)